MPSTRNPFWRLAEALNGPATIAALILWAVCAIGVFAFLFFIILFLLGSI